jgi:hypothetical protein
MSLDGKNKTTRTVILLTIIFLVIELLDELVDGVGGAAYPLIRMICIFLCASGTVANIPIQSVA